MSRNPIKPAKLGYTLEARICLTPDLADDDLHTHVTIFIDSGTSTGDRDKVLAKAYADFKSFLRFLQDDDGVPSFERFKRFLYGMSLQQVITEWDEPDDSQRSGLIPTHNAPEKIQ